MSEILDLNKLQTPLQPASNKSLPILPDVNTNLKAIRPLPDDEVADVFYNINYEPRCAICNCPDDVKLRIEHYYIQCSMQVQPVRKFIEEYYGCRASYESVQAHMERHCRMEYIVKSGLKDLALRRESLNVWKYQELDLCMTAMVAQIDELRGLNCMSMDDKIKQTIAIDKIVDKVLKIDKSRSESVQGLVDPFSLLIKVLASMECDEDKKHVIRIQKELKKQLTEKKFGI